MIRHAENKENVIVDGTFQKKKHRDQFRQEASKHTREVFFVEMRAAEDTVRQRLRAGRDHSEADYNVYRRIKQTFEQLEEPHLVLWTDNNNVEELIQQLKHYINEQRAGP